MGAGGVEAGQFPLVEQLVQPKARRQPGGIEQPDQPDVVACPQVGIDLAPGQFAVQQGRCFCLSPQYRFGLLWFLKNAALLLIVPSPACI
jgi:hypothetical protein